MASSSRNILNKLVTLLTTRFSIFSYMMNIESISIPVEEHLRLCSSFSLFSDTFISISGGYLGIEEGIVCRLSCRNPSSNSPTSLTIKEFLSERNYDICCVDSWFHSPILNTSKSYDREKLIWMNSRLHNHIFLELHQKACFEESLFSCFHHIILFA